MIRFLFSALTILSPWITCAQGAIISNDSSQLIFSNNVAIALSKTIKKGSVVYQLSPKAIRTLLTQYNFVNGVLELSQKRLALMEGEEAVKDSTILTLKQELKTTNERLLLYSSGYDELKSVTSAYDKQAKELLAELKSEHRKKRRSNRRNFLQGLSIGLALTVAYTIIHD